MGSKKFVGFSYRSFKSILPKPKHMLCCLRLAMSVVQASMLDSLEALFFLNVPLKVGFPGMCVVSFLALEG